jgi:peptide/nickel transport system substrate-binding protein
MACESEEFKDVRVRRAFNLAVDREAIIDNWLDGEGQAALNGFVPAMPNYPSEKVKGFVYNPTKAKALMAEAGYPNGKNFPTLDFYVNTVAGSATHKTCQGVAKQIKDNLGVELNIKLCELSEREAAIQSGKAKIWRSGWIADYPDPENFLTQFYGGNISENATMVNSFKFRNEAYDKLFSKAQTEIDPEKRVALLIQCDQMVIDQAATMPILTDDHIVMLNARIRDFEASPLENLNLTRVYIKEPKEEVKAD